MALTILPNAGQNLNQTRDPIRNNFNSINTTFNVNHVDFGLGDQGKHKWVTFPVQNAATAQAANIYPDIGLYSSSYALTGINELFFRNSGNAPSDVPFTASDAQWTLLPSGILMKWGTTPAIAAGATLNFAIPSGAAATGPAFTQLLNIQISAGSGAANNVTAQFIGLTGNNSFSLGSFTGTPYVSYLAIGRL